MACWVGGHSPSTALPSLGAPLWSPRDHQPWEHFPLNLMSMTRKWSQSQQETQDYPQSLGVMFSHDQPWTSALP